jgi:hypothetical protein
VLLGLGTAITGIAVVSRAAVNPALRSPRVPNYVGPGIHMGEPQKESVPSPTVAMAPVWSADHGSGYTLLPVAQGMNLNLTEAGDAQAYRPFGAEAIGKWVEVQGDVRFVSGGTGNALGLGCQTTGDTMYWFFIHDDGVWSFDKVGPGDTEVQLRVENRSPAISPTSTVNHLSVLCGSGSDGQAHFELTVNGTPVANLSLPVGNTYWQALISQCSPYGPDTGQFTNLALVMSQSS